MYPIDRKHLEHAPIIELNKKYLPDCYNKESKKKYDVSGRHLVADNNLKKKLSEGISR